MKKSIIYFISFLAFLTACSHKMRYKPSADFAIHQQLDGIKADSTYFGLCGEGTAMHTLQFISAKGDTVILPLGTADIPPRVPGGLLINSELAVTTAKAKDGMVYAKDVVNLSVLKGRWADGVDTIQLLNKGEVISSDPSYSTWKVAGSDLNLSGKSYLIKLLTNDSLYLTRHHKTLQYHRID